MGMCNTLDAIARTTEMKEIIIIIIFAFASILAEQSLLYEDGEVSGSGISVVGGDVIHNIAIASIISEQERQEKTNG